MNEPARHKLLDLLGDIALTGFRFKAMYLLLVRDMSLMWNLRAK